MSKKYHRKRSGKALEYIFIGSAIVLVLLVLALVFIPKTADNGGYVITEDGHVHDAAGNHIGDYDEMFGNGGYVVTEEGHVHDAAGNHIGNYDELFGEAAPVEQATEEAPAAE